MFETLKRQAEELLATVRSEVREEDEVGGQLTIWLKRILASPSVEWMDDIIGSESISHLKNVYQTAKGRDRGSDSLRKETARMLGSLMLNPDSEPEHIEFLSDDLQSFFSSTTYPHLSNEDDFFGKMEEAFMFYGPNENGLPPADKEKLLLLLDLPILSFSAIRIVEDYLEHNEWGPPVLSELRLRKFVRPKREYQLEQLVVVVTEADLRDDVARTAITDCFVRKPHTKCVLDVSGFLDGNGKLLTGKLEGLPSSVRHLSFTNGSCCTAIGDDILEQHPSLTTADFSFLQHVVRIGHKFLSRCKSLTSVHLPEELQMIGYDFLSCCDSLRMMDMSQYKVVVTEADLRDDVARTAITDLFASKPNTKCALDVSGFLNESGELLTGKLEYFPSSVRHLSFTNGSCCTEIGDDFLKDHPSLFSVDFSCLRNLKSIGYGFLSGCASLLSVDLSAFSKITEIKGNFFCKCSSLKTISNISVLTNVTSIGDSFLSRCTSLDSVNLSSFSKITEIKAYFLFGCSSLKTISNISVLASVTGIGNNFLSGCTSLESVDLSAFRSVTEIKDSFLYECSSLKTISNITVLTNVTSIGYSFLSECSSLGAVDLSAFSKITEIKAYFLYYCSSLKTITNLSVLTNVTSIGDNFLPGCTSLESVDLSAFSKITEIKAYFLYYCSSLKTISTITVLTNVTSIENNFLSRCNLLRSVDLSSFSKITSISDYFLRDCSCLKTISNITVLTNVTSIGHDFLSRCSSLGSVDLSAFSKVVGIKASFLSRCSSLKTISNITVLTSTTKVGKSFLSGCSSLESVDLSAFSKITEIKDDFLFECSSLKTVSNLSVLANVTSIGNNFLSRCASLESVDLSAFSKITDIKDSFLCECSSLKAICCISGLGGVNRVGDSFLKGCKSLTPINVSDSEHECLSDEMKNHLESLNKLRTE